MWIFDHNIEWAAVSPFERQSPLVVDPNVPRTPVLFEIIASKQGGKVFVLTGHLSTWIWLDNVKTLVVPEHVILGVVQKKQKSSSTKLAC